MLVLLLSYYVVWSLIAFVVYGIDKSAAKRNRWRVSEPTLHTLSLLGGWPGALLGQKVFRHKTKKIRYRIVFWVTLVVNIMLALSAFLVITGWL